MVFHSRESIRPKLWYLASPSPSPFLPLSFSLNPLIVFSEVSKEGYRWGGVRFCVLFLAWNDVVSSFFSFFFFLFFFFSFGNNSFTFSFSYEIKKLPKMTLFWLVKGNNQRKGNRWLNCKILKLRGLKWQNWNLKAEMTKVET